MTGWGIRAEMRMLLQEDKIVKIGDCAGEEADVVIDARGKIVCPGFVDIHRHHDAKVLFDKAFGQTELRQGITDSNLRQLRHQPDAQAPGGREGGPILCL